MRIHKGQGAPTFCRHLLIAEAKRQGVTRAELAARTGLGIERILAYWVGKNRPIHENMLRLAKALETETGAFCR